MSQVRNVIGERRASGAGVLVVGLEHVVIDDQLASPFEHVEKARRPVRPGCLERRIDLGHRQASTLRRNCVTGVRMRLLGDQQLVAGLLAIPLRTPPVAGPCRHGRALSLSSSRRSSSSSPPLSHVSSRRPQVALNATWGRRGSSSPIRVLLKTSPAAVPRARRGTESTTEAHVWRAAQSSGHGASAARNAATSRARRSSGIGPGSGSGNGKGQPGRGSSA